MIFLRTCRSKLEFLVAFKDPSLRLLPVLCMMHVERVSAARPPVVLPLLSGAAHNASCVCLSVSLSLTSTRQYESHGMLVIKALSL